MAPKRKTVARDEPSAKKSGKEILKVEFLDKLGQSESAFIISPRLVSPEGATGLLSICLSVHPSILPSIPAVVFQTFFAIPLNIFN